MEEALEAYYKKKHRIIQEIVFKSRKRKYGEVS
jgi:hypothetical protein